MNFGTHRTAPGSVIGNGRARSVPLTLLVILMALSCWVPASATADDGTIPPGDPDVGTSGYHQVIMFQGDDPETDTEEPRDYVIVTERTYWRIPLDSDTVYTYIPGDAENAFTDNVRVFEHQGQTLFIPGPFSAAVNPDDPPGTGEVDAGDYKGMSYWRFPAGADRSERTSLVFSSDEDWNDYDPDLTTGEEWNVTSGTLSLNGSLPEGTYTSKMYTSGVDAVSVNMTVMGEAKDNMSFEVTWDNGSTWHAIEEGKVLPADGEGNGFRWRSTMTQNLSMGISPLLEEVMFNVTFMPEDTYMWLETTYHLRVPQGGALDFRMAFPFDSEDSTLTFIGYFDNDMDLDVNGTVITVVPDSTYPDRTTYIHMQGAFDRELRFTATDLREGDETSGSLGWVVVASLVILILVLAAVLMTRSGEGELPPSEDEEAGLGEGPFPDVDVELLDREELEEMKVELLEGISQLDRDHEEGLLDDEEHAERRAELKGRAVKVMKELEKLE